jgi:asparagine synthase (glutamine-hydrolysing)
MPSRVQRLIRWGVDRLPVSHNNFSFDFKAKQFVKGAGAVPELAHQIWLGSFGDQDQEMLLTEDARRQANGPSVERQHLALAETIEGADLVDRLTRLYCRTYLAEDILTKADRASMAVSLELRAPFMDPGLVSFITSLPSRYKLRGRQTKLVFRRAMASRLPRVVLQRPKKGFGIPVARWLHTHLRDLTGDLLAPGRLRDQGLFDERAISRLVEDHWNGRRDNRKGLWTLIMFQLWYDRYM